MARKATDTSTDTHPAMDYAQHNFTYAMFVTLLKWGIGITAGILVALYFIVIAQEPVLGTVLLFGVPVVALAMFVMRPRRTA